MLREREAYLTAYLLRRPFIGIISLNADGTDVILTLHTNLELPTLSKPTLDKTGLACRQGDLQPHKQLEVGLLLEQAASDHRVIVSRLSTREGGEPYEL